MDRHVETSNDALIGANPAPLGYAALALTTALFGAFEAGRFHAGGLPFAGMLLFYGGLALLIAGILAYRNRDTFQLTIFGSFGAFWMGLGLLFLFDALGRLTSPMFVGRGIIWFWFVWAIVATYIWIASIRISAAVALVQLLLAAMFWALWLGSLTGSQPGSGWAELSGWLGWAAAVVAGYTSFAELINRTFGRIVLPEFPTTTMQSLTR